MPKHPFAKHAIILAAGTGSRLRPFTDLRPKPLVEVHGTPILLNALRNLEAVGVTTATIVVGYRKDAIQYACGRTFGTIEIDYVESTDFQATGSAYSLWLARESVLVGDCYLLEADVFFENAVLRRLQMPTAQNVTAVVPFGASMEGSAVVLGSDGAVADYRLKQSMTDLAKSVLPLFKTINLSRFSRQTMVEELWPALDAQVQAGKTEIYLEQVLSRLVLDKRICLEPVRCDGLRWFEIDTPEDLRDAEVLFANPGGDDVDLDREWAAC